MLEMTLASVVLSYSVSSPFLIVSLGLTATAPGMSVQC